MIANYFASLDWSVITDFLIAAIPALLCVTIHELCHGFVAYRLGDNTAKNAGRLTLNPIKHIDPLGLIAMIVIHFGWAKAVPVNMYNFKNPKTGMAITALAGPMSNFILAIAALLLYGLLFVPLSTMGVAAEIFLQMIYITAYLSIALGIFNLIPVPPLDGSKILFSLLPDEQYYKLLKFERYGMLIVAAVIMSGMFAPFLSQAINLTFNWLFGLAFWASELLG